jgi:hypothetical protein
MQWRMLRLSSTKATKATTNPKTEEAESLGELLKRRTLQLKPMQMG